MSDGIYPPWLEQQRAEAEVSEKKSPARSTDEDAWDADIDRLYLAGGAGILGLLYKNGDVHLLNCEADHNLTSDELENLEEFCRRALELRADEEEPK